MEAPDYKHTFYLGDRMTTKRFNAEPVHGLFFAGVIVKTVIEKKLVDNPGFAMLVHVNHDLNKGEEYIPKGEQQSGEVWVRVIHINKTIFAKARFYLWNSVVKGIVYLHGDESASKLADNLCETKPSYMGVVAYNEAILWPEKQIGNIS